MGFRANAPHALQSPQLCGGKIPEGRFYRSVSQILDTLATNGRPTGFAPRIKEEHPTTTQAVSKRVQCKEKWITALRKIQKSMKITNRKDPEEEPSYHRVEKLPECRGAVSHQVQSMK